MGFIGNMKQMLQATSQARRMKNEIDKISVEYANGGISVTARGDFSITAIKISPEAWKEAAGGKPERFETMLFNVVNGAIKNVRKVLQEQMLSQIDDIKMPNSLFGK